MYRLRSKQWQDKAAALPAGPERDTCLVIADGYAGLARIGQGCATIADDPAGSDASRYAATC